MIYASARSVREERSRQRFALQDFSRITVSLIKGKTGWRIGSVQSEGNYFVEATDRAVRGSIVRICKLLRRFVAGEEPHPNLYDEIIVGLTHLAAPAILNRSLIEEIILTRLLYNLGYIASAPGIDHVLEGNLEILCTQPLDAALLARLRTITEKATTASHL